MKKEIIIRSIKILNRKIKSIELTLNAEPIKELIDLRIEFQKILKKTSGDWKANELREFVKIAAEKEKKLKTLIEKQQNTSELIAQLVNMREEVSLLEKELYYMDCKK
jgi:hypothetical protein